MSVKSWATKCEIQWINNIGKAHPFTMYASRLHLLKQLRDAYRRRNHWGGIDRAVVESHLKTEIETLSRVVLS